MDAYLYIYIYFFWFEHVKNYTLYFETIIIYFYIEPRSQSRDGFFTHLQTLKNTHTQKKTKKKHNTIIWYEEECSKNAAAEVQRYDQFNQL